MPVVVSFVKPIDGAAAVPGRTSTEFPKDVTLLGLIDSADCVDVAKVDAEEEAM